MNEKMPPESKLSQALHAAISRRDWNATEAAANAIRDERPPTGGTGTLADLDDLETDYARDVPFRPPMTNPETSSDLVKRLEWRRPPHNDTLQRADTPFGAYRVWSHSEAAGGVWFWNFDGYEKSSGEARSEAEGLTACQADFDARILSALTDNSRQPGEGGVAPVAYLYTTEWGDRQLGFASEPRNPQWKARPLYASPPSAALSPPVKGDGQ